MTTRIVQKKHVHLNIFTKKQGRADAHRHYWEVLTPEERNDPLWDPDKEDHWMTFFTEHRLAELAHYEGSGPPPANKNAATRKIWWGVLCRTLAWVLDHIAAGNYLRLTMPRRHWLPQRMDGPVSSSLRLSSSTPSSGIIIGTPPSALTRLLRPKKEPGSSGASSARVKNKAASPASFTRIQKEPGVTLGSLARVKKEPGVPPSLKKVRRLAEDTALQLEYQASDDPVEFPGLKAAELASFNEVQPGSLDFALAWSR
jgi:hypothetical protein